MEDSVFTKIVKGELPSHKVYEDDKTIVFMPLHMIGKGHVLVVPKKQVDQFFELPEEDYLALSRVVQKAAKRMDEILKPKRIGIQVIGLDVAHVHYHVIAFDTLEEYLDLPDQTAEADHQALAEMAKKLSF